MSVNRLPDYLLANGELLQYAIFFGLLMFSFVIGRVWPYRQPITRQGRRLGTNALMTVLCILSLGFVPISFVAAAHYAQSNGFGLLNQLESSLPLFVGVTLLFRGFISTFTRLLNHKLSWLWRIHRIHHMDPHLDVSTSVRMHPLEFMIGPVIGVPFVLFIGLEPWVLVLYELFDVSIILFSHSNIAIPPSINRWLRYLIATPNFRRIHRSARREETDSDYSAVFPIWNVILGTFRTETYGDPKEMRLGLIECDETTSTKPGSLLVSPFIGWPS